MAYGTKPQPTSKGPLERSLPRPMPILKVPPPPPQKPIKK